MNVVIRTDASIEIGTGHIMRCLTLANQLKRHGLEVTFVCRKLEGDSVTYLLNQGFKVTILPSVESQVEWQLDAEETIKILKEMDDEVDLIIVDHYRLDSRWESILRRHTRYMMIIDDLANRPHDCDLLLDQNYYLNMEQRYSGLVPERCIQMLGPDYVLLRDEFLQAADRLRERVGEINNILVFFGGTDPTGETIKVLEAIKELNIDEIEFNIVVGASNPRCNEIKKMCSGIAKTNYYCQVGNMAELMWEADLSIGAGGSTTWERCLLGLPSITVVLADNQYELTRAMVNLGSTIYLGKNFELTKDSFKKEIMRLVQDPTSLKVMSEKCAKIINPQIVREYPVTKNIMELLL